MDNDKLQHYIQVAHQQLDLARAQQLVAQMRRYTEAVASALKVLQDVRRLREELEGE
jgi:hypothetical protein